MASSEKKNLIQELRHQLYYTNPGPERDEVRRQLEYWIYYSRRF